MNAADELARTGQAPVNILEAFPLAIGGPAPAPGEPVPRRPSRRCGVRVAIYGDWNDTVRTPGGAPHGAQDIFAPRWWPVLSPVAGRVASVANTPRGGHNLTVRTRTGATVYMAHLEAPPLVARGQRLEVGQPLGYVGNTGSASRTCPHLHISARSSSGTKVNLFAELQRLLTAWRAASRGKPTPPSVLEGGPADSGELATVVAAGAGGGVVLLVLALLFAGTSWHA